MPLKSLLGLAFGAATLTACVSVSPPRADNARAYADFLVGRVANLREDHAVASDRYFEALQHAPRDRHIAEGGARAALAAGDISRARAFAAAARTPDASAVRLVRAADQLVAGRWSAARAAIDQMQGDIDEEFAARFIGLWSKAGEGRTDEALSDLDRLSAPRPFSGVFAYQRALALDLAGRNEDARDAYRKASEEGLWLPPAVVREADLLVRMGRMDEARALIAAKRETSLNPELEAADNRLAAGRALDLAPLTAARGAALGLYGFGALLAQESDVESGLVTLTLARQLDPTLDAAAIAFAEAQRDSGHDAPARAALASLSPSSPYAQTARLMEAWMLREEGKEEEALAAARAAAASGGQRGLIALADLYRSFERYGEAEPIYGRLIDSGAEEWRLYFARGAARERLGRWPEAEADLQRALALSPDQPDVLNYLGYSWVDRGEKLNEGLAMISRAAELRPQSGAIIDSLGWAYFKLGDYERAIGHLERAVELEPADPILNDHLGDAYWRLGRRLEARFQWRRALTLDPEAGEIAKIERKLEAGLPEPAPLADARTR